MIRIHKWRRPRLRLYPAKPKIDIRAAKPNDIWHFDTNQIKLLDGCRVYIHPIKDNFSLRVLAWNVSDTCNPAVTASLLRKALEGSTSETQALMVDGGIESFYTSVDEAFKEGLLERVLAQTEKSFSN